MNSGPTAGVFALAFGDLLRGVAVGGDFLAPTASPNAFARTLNSGISWQLPLASPSEYRSGATWVAGSTAIAVGPSGSDSTTDWGTTWQGFSTESFDTVDCAGIGACWASGANGNAGYLLGSP
jgi:hypothetical protein